ncbi:uncharacterized protein PV07_01718 [Cladophialophora immunda]|uniref:Uncharacterized protein n=1 Tax=Cladophialophora immunda TaxID=569365 RepID=A0A0D2A3X4_9EURO|nr:uncharacterized protein PV07_01718 [Cladophialophora immunda]KIW34991.1 hypothetical protein PV07_01718 [Cladophialophora immunda]
METKHSPSAMDLESSVGLLDGQEPDSSASKELEEFVRSELSVGKKRSLRAKLVIFALRFFVGLMAFIGIMNTVNSLVNMRVERFVPSYDNPKHAAEYSNHPCYCGESVAEALSKGCVFDELSTAWLPERCRDEELAAEFASKGDGPNGTWLYWADKEHTQPLSVHDISMYADLGTRHLFHMSIQWHRQHCLYSWLKEHRFKTRPDKVFDPRSDSDGHIYHCMMVFNSPREETEAGAVLEV